MSLKLHSVYSSSKNSMNNAGSTHRGDGSLQSLQLGASGGGFKLWKMKIVSYFQDKEIHDVVEHPIAPDEKLVHALLSVKQSAKEDEYARVWASFYAVSVKIGALAGASSSSSSSPPVAPIAAPTGAELKDAVKNSRTAHRVLLQCLPDETLHLLSTVKSGDAHSVWSIVLKKHERNTVANQHHTRGKLHTIKMERGESFDSYLARIQEIQIRLVEMNSPVSDNELVYLVLNGLPESYNLVVHTLQAKNGVTIEDIAEACRDYQETAKLRIEKEESANYVKEQAWQQQGGGGRDRRRGTAQEQQKSNTMSAGAAGAGPSSSSSGAASRDRLTSMKCHLCSKLGHVMFDCPFLPRDAQKCASCRRLGHVEADCNRGRRVRSQQGAGKPASREDADFVDVEEEEWSNFAHEIEEDAGLAVLAEAAVPSRGVWSNGPPDAAWVLDSGASRSMVRDAKLLTNMQQAARVNVRTAGGHIVSLEQAGAATLTGVNGGALTLKNVMHSPSLATNLLSVAAIVDANAEVTFRAKDAVVKDVRSKKTLAVVPRVGNVWMWPAEIGMHLPEWRQRHAEQAAFDSEDVVQAVPATPVPVPAIVVPAGSMPIMSARPTAAVSRIKLLHDRLGHPSMQRLVLMVKSNAVRGLEPLKLTPENVQAAVRRCADIDCSACKFGKEHRRPFASARDSSDAATAIMDAMHTDLSGPTKVESIDGGRYAGVSLDAHSQMVWVDVMAQKDEARCELLRLIKKIEVQTGRKLKRFHSDGGGEYQHREFIRALEEAGTTVTNTPARTSQLNGKAERKIRTLWNLTRTLLHSAGKHGLPASFWSEAIRTAAYVLNRTVSRASGDPTKTAIELFTGKKPSVKHLRVFGCDVFVYQHAIDRPSDRRLDARSKKGIFIGYDEKKQAYRCWVEGRVVVSRDVSFLESSFTQADALHAELTSGANSNEEERLSVVEERRAAEHRLPKTNRRARRAAAIQLYQPLDEEEEEREMRKAIQASLEQEEKVQTVQEEQAVQQEERKQEEQVHEERAVQSSIPSVPSREESDPLPPSPAPPVSVPRPTTSVKHAVSAPAASPSRSLRSRPAELVPGLSAVEDSKSNEKAGTLVDARMIVEPRTLKEALASPQREHWLDAAKKELNSLLSKRAWRYVPALQCTAAGRRPIGSKWIFKVKLHADGTVERYKARLVAQGFTQREGIDYFDVFAPTLRYKTLRVLLQLAAVWNYELKQMDVDTAFLNGEMKEEVYMKLPPGLETISDAVPERGGEMVCLLQKALYGTKQASHVWNETINAVLVRECGFRACTADPCLYVLISRTGNPILLGLFVDDLIIGYTKADEQQWIELKSKLLARFTMKDLDDAVWVLGMKIERDRSARTLLLTQSSYIEKLLHSFNMSDSAPQETPEDASVRLSKADEASSEEESKMMERVPYMELVGSLLYASTSVRIDIAHVVGVLARYMQKPGVKHWKTAKRCLRYLKGTKDMGIQYGARGARDSSASSNSSSAYDARCPLTMFVDADWAGDVDDRRSTTGCVIMLYGAPVIWLSKKQATVALSTAEAEYMAMSAGVQELKFALQLLNEIGLTPILPVPVYSDNQAAISISSTAGVPHSRTKHIDLRHHYVRELVSSGELRVEWIGSKDQLADVLTKGLNKSTYASLTQRIMEGREREE